MEQERLLELQKAVPFKHQLPVYDNPFLNRPSFPSKSCSPIYIRYLYVSIYYVLVLWHGRQVEMQWL